MDLVDGRKNSAMLMRHVEDPASSSAEDIKQPFNGGMEGGVDWDPKEFTMIRVESEKKKARGETIAYDLMPRATERRGTTSGSPTMTCGSAARIRSGRSNTCSSTCPTPSRMRTGRAGGHRPLVQFGRAPRARNEDGKPGSGTEALAGRRRRQGLGAGDVERGGSPPSQPLRSDAVLPVHAAPAAPASHGAAPGGRWRGRTADSTGRGRGTGPPAALHPISGDSRPSSSSCYRCAPNRSARMWG